MVHPDAEQRQSPLAAQGVVGREKDRRVGSTEDAHHQASQAFPQFVDLPGSLAEEAVVIGEVPVAHRVAGNDQVRDVTMAYRHNPSGHEQLKRLKTGSGKNRSESP